MNIVVLVRCPIREPESQETLEGLDPGDTAALTTALRLAGNGADDSVVAVTAGSAIHEPALIRALRVGAHRAIRISDPALDGGDVNTVGSVLATGIRSLSFDLIIAGNWSSDWGSGATGPTVAHFLGIPHVTAVTDIRWHDRAILVTHRRERAAYSIRLGLPALVAVSAGADMVLEEREAATVPQILDLADMTLPRVAQPPPASLATIEQVTWTPQAPIDNIESLVQLLRSSGSIC